MFALHVWCTKSLDLLSISFSVVQRGVELKNNFKSCFFFFFFASHISLERRNTHKRCVRLCHARQNVHPLLIVHPEAFPTCNPPLKTFERLWQKVIPLALLSFYFFLALVAFVTSQKGPEVISAGRWGDEPTSSYPVFQSGLVWIARRALLPTLAPRDQTTTNSTLLRRGGDRARTPPVIQNGDCSTWPDASCQS